MMFITQLSEAISIHSSTSSYLWTCVLALAGAVGTMWRVFYRDIRDCKADRKELFRQNAEDRKTFYDQAEKDRKVFHKEIVSLYEKAEEDRNGFYAETKRIQDEKHVLAQQVFRLATRCSVEFQEPIDLNEPE